MQNLAFGWCAITALGDYDPTLGGHLVLWDLGIIIEFPPGSTILIPSACIKHSNISIQPHETRYSIVQYAAGDLFKWSAETFDGVKSYRYGTTSAVDAGKKRVQQFMDMFSTESQLRAECSPSIA